MQTMYINKKHKESHVYSLAKIWYSDQNVGIHFINMPQMRYILAEILPGSNFNTPGENDMSCYKLHVFNDVSYLL